MSFFLSRYSDVEGNLGNPMVMGFQDEIDDEDFRPTKVRHPVVQVKVEYSSGKQILDDA